MKGWTWTAWLVAVAVVAAPMAGRAATESFDFNSGGQGWAFTTSDGGTHTYQLFRFSAQGAPAPCIGVQGFQADGNEGRIYGMGRKFAASPGSTVAIAWSYRVFSLQVASFQVLIRDHEGKAIHWAEITAPSGEWRQAQTSAAVLVPGSAFWVYFYFADQAGDQQQGLQIDTISVTVSPPAPGTGTPDGGAVPDPEPQEPQSPSPPVPPADSGEPLEPNRPGRRAITEAAPSSGCGTTAAGSSLLSLVLLLARRLRAPATKRHPPSVPCHSSPELWQGESPGFQLPRHDSNMRPGD